MLSRGRALLHGVLKDIKGWRNVPQLPLSRVLFLSAHTPILGFKSGLCARCGSFVRGTTDNLRQWLLSPCEGNDYAELLENSVGKPVAVPPQYRVKVAGVALHESHTLQVYKHLYFCVDCGKVAGHRVQQLGEACSPLGQGVVWGRQVPTGVRNLRRIRQGLTPQGTPYWPSAIPVAIRGHTVSL